MKEKDIIKKWLDHELLTTSESEAFKNLDAYDSFMKISETAKKFKAPAYEVETHLLSLQKDVRDRPLKKPKHNLTLWFKIAAVFVIGLGIYFAFFKFENTPPAIATAAGEQKSVILPDQSELRINALSYVRYDKKDWQNNRILYLEGEAYFKVATGKRFDVRTKSGVVSVIGTQFNVKQRENYFEVVCYEGVVNVFYDKETAYLQAGDGIEIANNTVHKKITTLSSPRWLGGKSIFSSVPYAQVLKEFEWQYGVTFEAKNIDQSKLFTGNFVHSNIDFALQSITIPMRLKYKINDNRITLYKE